MSMSSQALAPAVPSAKCDERSRENAFVVPRWFYQQDSWVEDPENSDTVAYNYPLSLRIRGPLNEIFLEASLQELVRRHAVLRSVFQLSRKQLLQIVQPPRPFSLRRKDLTVFREAERESLARQFVFEESRRPFNLTRDLLLRGSLLRLGPDHHILTLLTHHLVYDDWSNRILVQELTDLYNAFSAGEASPLAEVNHDYGDFVRWINNRLSGQALSSHLAFWQSQFGGRDDFHHLLSDRRRPARRSYHGAAESTLLPVNLADSLKRWSQTERASLFMALLAGFQLLLHRYSGQTDIAVGSCAANRTRVEVESLIGRFGNHLVIRTDWRGNPTVREALNRVRESSITAYSYQELPFGAVVDAIQPIPQADRNPLFQVMFVFQNAPKGDWRIPGLELSWLPIEAGTAKYDLSVWLREREGLEVTLEYNTDLFELATIQRISEDYRNILETMVKNPEARIDDLVISLRPPSEPPPQRETSGVELSGSLGETERQLTKIWEQILGVQPIGMRQDFFELGGDSLQAVRLFAKIEKLFEVRLPLSTLLEVQTIEGLAQILRHQGPASKGNSLVAVQSRGSRPPLFFVHGAGGNVLIYRDLARHLGPDQPFYGLQSQGMDGRLPFLDRIEDMAATYVEEIRTVQPEGPYFLGGYCMGGTVALEMAQQLLAQGQDLALLALLDTSNWARVAKDSFLSRVCFQMQKVVFHCQNFWLLDLGGKLRFLQGKLQVLKNRSVVWFGAVLTKFVRNHWGEQPHSSNLAQLWDVNERAAFAYMPKVYPGRITHFRPLRQYRRYAGPERGWDQLARGGVEVCDMPVYPAGMLLEPFVEQIAKKLGHFIEQSSNSNGFPRELKNPW